jgi:hypothetical protein
MRSKRTSTTFVADSITTQDLNWLGLSATITGGSYDQVEVGGHRFAGRFNPFEITICDDQITLLVRIKYPNWREIGSTERALVITRRRDK